MSLEEAQAVLAALVLLARRAEAEQACALAELLSRRGMERPCETLVAWAREAEKSAVLFYGVVSDELEEAIELFANRREAERIIENWDRDEPDRAGEPRVEPIELETASN